MWKVATLKKKKKNPTRSSHFKNDFSHSLRRGRPQMSWQVFVVSWFLLSDLMDVQKTILITFPYFSTLQ